MSATTVQQGEATPVKSLTAHDRCVGCGAQAYVEIEHIDHGNFLFCLHHWKKNDDALRPGAITIHDETHKLLPQPYDPSTDND
jgi:hypothetical protein